MRATPVAAFLRAADRLRPFAANPPPQHWLTSDATLSYCRACVRLAHWFELDRMGPPPPECDWWCRTPDDEEIVDGIDGGDWYSGESDSAQFCALCQRMLRFALTDYGVSHTLVGFSADALDGAFLRDAEGVYELMQVLDAGAWLDDDADTIAALRPLAAAVRRLTKRRSRVAA